MEPQDLARTLAFPPRPSAEEPALATSHSRAYLLPATGALPEGADLVATLADGARFAYACDGGGPAREVVLDPFLRGNAFKPVHDSPRAQAALLSVAASRRLETGPESERLFVFLRGSGLVFLENGDVHKFAPGFLGVVPPGEPAKLWAQGPDDALALVVQPKGERAARRTLAGELAKLRAAKK